MRWYQSLRFKLAAGFSALMVVTAAVLFPLVVMRLHDSGEQLARERAAEGMSSMIDGIWVRAALTQEAPDLRQAHAIADDYLRMTLQYHGAGRAPVRDADHVGAI